MSPKVDIYRMKRSTQIVKISKVESDTQARHFLFFTSEQKQQKKKEESQQGGTCNLN